MRFAKVSFEDTEQVHVIIRWTGRLEFFAREPIGQSFGIAGAAGSERTGQFLAAQQARDAQHEFEAA